MVRTLRRWFSSQKVKTVRRSQLEFESLEDRYCPTPVLHFTVSQAPQHMINVAGTVVTDAPGSSTVSFTGIATFLVATNSQGVFTGQGYAFSLGELDGQATDSQGNQSDTVAVTLSNDAPQITSFQAVQGFGNFWTFQGTVADEAPGGLTVTLGGLPSLQGQTATVNSDGTFSLTVDLGADDSGTATAQTVDWWSVSSNLAETIVDR